MNDIEDVGQSWPLLYHRLHSTEGSQAGPLIIGSDSEGPGPLGLADSEAFPFDLGPDLGLALPSDLKASFD